MKNAIRGIENIQIGKKYVKHYTDPIQKIELGRLQWIIWENNYGAFGDKQEILLVFEKYEFYAADCGVIPYHGKHYHGKHYNPFNFLILQEEEK